MHFFLIHSPLVPKETWLALDVSLKASGAQVLTVKLDNLIEKHSHLYEHHVAQIEATLTSLDAEKVIAVAHSGAGNLLALINPKRFAGHVFLDAIFPVEQSTRFDSFDDTVAVKGWQNMAVRHQGVLPGSMLMKFGEQIEPEAMRSAFVSEIVDVPIKLYEENIPVHTSWPRVRHGLYVQWTDSYSADALRAKESGFEVLRDPASHFEMLNHPDKVAKDLMRFAADCK